MNAVMGQIARNGRFGAYAARAGVLVLGLVMLTGCKNQEHEDQMSALNAEIAQLQDEKTQLTAANTTLQSQLSMAQQQAADAAARAAKPAPTDTGMSDGGGSRPRQADVVIEVAGDVLFASGQVTLKPEAKSELDRVASTLKSRYSGNVIRVEGYTDSDPIRKSKFASNEALSQARAEAVEKYLISKGISSSRISAVGMGSAKPRATKAASRRVEIVVLGN